MIQEFIFTDKIHYVKTESIRSFFCFVFSHIWISYEDLQGSQKTITCSKLAIELLKKIFTIVDFAHVFACWVPY